MPKSTDNRDEYSEVGFSETEADPDPFVQFGKWFAAANQTEFLHPEAMTLATATPDGIVTARIVLLKGFDEKGFVFFTNYESSKARELQANPRAALLFWWGQLQRQVRLTGKVEQVPSAESDEYFATRPRSSQIGAWASAQSRVIAGRETLEQSFKQLEDRFHDRQVERPPHWGGYRLAPDTFEFWQGRSSRLHDRIRYVKASSGGWKIERLAP